LSANDDDAREEPDRGNGAENADTVNIANKQSAHVHRFVREHIYLYMASTFM